MQATLHRGRRSQGHNGCVVSVRAIAKCVEGSGRSRYYSAPLKARLCGTLFAYNTHAPLHVTHALLCAFSQQPASFHELASFLSIDLEVLRRRERVVGAGIKAPDDRPEG